MARSMIAVCLLLLSPGAVIACDQDHNAGAGWFDEQSLRFTGYGNGGRAVGRDWVADVSHFAGGVGVAILLGVLGRGMFKAARRTCVAPLGWDERMPLADPFYEPLCEPGCGWSTTELDEDE
jgi:hypothetical protein